MAATQDLNQPAAPRERSARRAFAATTLGSEAFVVFFATLVAFGLGELDRVLVWTVGLAVSVLCLVIAGLLPRRWAYGAGWAIQALLIAGAIWVPALVIIGVVFGVIWIVGETVGKRIDVERRARAAAEAAAAANHDAANSDNPADDR